LTNVLPPPDLPLLLLLLLAAAAAAAAAAADGWGFSQMQSSNSLKMSIIGGIHAVHYFRGAQLQTQQLCCPGRV